MANFCSKCGSHLTEQGVCPVCNPPAPVRRFCMRCGQVVNADGLCPVCDAPAPVVAPVAEPAATTVPVEAPIAPIAEEAVVVEDAPVEEKISLADAAVAVAVAEEAPAEEIPAEAALADEIPPVQEGKKKKKGHGAATVIMTILLSLCLFITTTLAISVLAVRHTVSAGGIATVFEKADLPTLLKTSGAANSKNFQKLYDRLEENYAIEMDDDKLAEFIDESTVPEFVAEKATEFAAAFFEDEAELTITKREMEDLVWQNRKLIAEYSDDNNLRLEKEDCTRIAGWMFKGNSIGFNTENLMKNSPVIYYSATIGLSYVSFGFFALLSALILFIMCRNSLSQAAIGSGVVFLILGGSSSLAIAFVELIPSLWATIAGNNIVFNLAGTLLSVNAVIFLVLFGLGILALVTRAVVKAIVAKKAQA